MFNRESARVRSSIQRYCIGLALLAAGLFAGPSWAFNGDTEKAVSGYLNVTLPTIAKLRPVIDKPASERAGAIAAMGVKDSVCDAPRLDAIGAREHLAEGAGHLCGALIAWMHDEDIFTCSRVKMSGIEFAKTDPAGAEIARRHKADDIVSTRLQLQAAAGCTGKAEAYWGVKTLRLYDQLAASVSKTGDLVAPSNGGAAPTAQAFKDTVFLCHLSSGLDDNTKSGVIDAANYGCYALNYVSTRELLEACRTLKKAIDKSTAVSSSDPLAGEAAGLALKLTRELGVLDCRETIATAEVKQQNAASAKQAAAEPSAQAAPNPNARRSMIMAMIKVEMTALNNAYDAGQRSFDNEKTYDACGYYQQALTTLRRLETLYSELHQETGDSRDSAKPKETRDRENDLLEKLGDTCAGVGRRLN